MALSTSVSLSTGPVDAIPAATPTRDSAVGGVLVGVVLSAIVVAYLAALLLFPPPRARVLAPLFPSPVNDGRLRTMAASVRRLDGDLFRAADKAARGSRRAVTEHTRYAAQVAASLEALQSEVPARDAASPGIARALTGVRTRLAIEKHAIAQAKRGRTADALQALASGRYRGARQTAVQAGVGLERAVEAFVQRDRAARTRQRQWCVLAALALLGILWVVLTIRLRRLGVRQRRAAAQAAEWQQTARQQEKLRLDAEQALRDRDEELERARTALDLQIAMGRRADTRANRLESAVESTNDVVMICEATADGKVGRLLYVNPAFEQMTGYTREELAHHTPRILQGPRTDPKTLVYLRSRLRAFEPVRAELINYRKDGSEFWVELNIQPLLDANGIPNGWMSIQRDITERKLADERIKFQATHDALTGLPNRYLYEQRLGEALEFARARNASVGVLFFDLDRFKQVNDTLGHPVGDKLLQEVARRLRLYLSAGEMVARMGGDEFTILLPHIEEQEQAEAVARKILQAMEEPFQVEGQELFVSASLGISIAPRDGMDNSTLLKNADVAMYRAKEEGRDSYRLYSRSMEAVGHDRLVLESSLRKAIERDEIFLLYQPQMELLTGEIVGVEALVRWENQQLGRVSPAEFIPLAEETGLIVSLGDYILREACRQAARWYRSGRPLRVSVNIASRQLEQKDLVTRVADILRENGLPAEWLDIEMTERMLVRNELVGENLEGLKRLGVRLSVDDFGTGYSAFSYIHKFPLDIIKVDKTFITNLGEDRPTEAVVRLLVELAHELGWEVVAEGVETEQQRSILTTLGCDAMQGYLLSPATSPREVEALLARPPLLRSGSHLRVVAT